MTLFTVEDLAERWQVTKAHVHRLAREGKIPTIRVGRYQRFHPEEIERWERAQAEGGAR